MGELLESLIVQGDKKFGTTLILFFLLIYFFYLYSSKIFFFFTLLIHQFCQAIANCIGLLQLL